MEKYSKEDISNMLMLKGQTSMLNVPRRCSHANIVKSYHKGTPYKYVCTECGMPSRNRGAFFKYQNSGRMIH
ncbi:hypothetical protein [Salinicoccus halodurans]|uniref:Uncharacterized protein n=1 Tax=Salinicoccus halodurans TaxID=407035 RepID=A0A0F7HL64_9STAP|nr:hypothetical protein [Salinicoccus halodurans]AKG73601.1 hypothetical protein AAT16_04865 [Salinicoccus halodurans]SFK53224.1 hypothetical protein SAMN05216235_0210 [Salinicoccus halodurans]